MGFSRLCLKFIAIFALLALLGSVAMASFEVYRLAFRKTIPTPSNFNDSSETDTSGYVLAFIKNTGATDEVFTPASYTSPGTSQAVKINGSYADAIQSNSGTANVRWWRIFPSTIPPGGVGCVVVKSKNSSFVAEGLSCTIVVKNNSGVERTITGILKTPDVRIGDVIPSADRKTLYIFLRNSSGSASYTSVNQVIINTIDVTSQSTIINGGAMGPNQVGIIKVNYPQPLALHTLLNLEIKVTKSDSTTDWTCGSVRLIDGNLTIGTWSTALPANPQYAKQLGINTGVYDNDYRTGDRYHIGMIRGAASGSYPDGIDHAYLASNATFNSRAENGAWMIADEPDITSTANYFYAYQNTVYWNEGPNYPTFVNICKSKKANEYSQMADIVSIDHYVFGTAPLQISTRYAWQALEYTECLKQNAEPVRTWVFSQLRLSSWTTQPPIYGIDYQFWAHIFAGAKGILHFRYAPGDESGSGAAATAKAVSLYKKLNQVRWLALYSEPSTAISATPTQPIPPSPSTARVRARALVGEKACLIALLNDSMTNASCPTYSGTITYTVPDHIPLQLVKRVTDTGMVTLVNGSDYTISGRTVTINYSNFSEETFVYYIGENDTTPPEPPTAINISKLDSPANSYELNFRESRDNVGILRYHVYVNGVLKVTTHATICTYRSTTPVINTQIVINDPVNDVITIKAEDSSGNLSDASTYKIAQFNFNWEGVAEIWRGNSATGPLNVENGTLNYTQSTASADIEIQNGSTSAPPLNLVDTNIFGTLHVRLANGTQGGGVTGVNAIRVGAYNGSSWTANVGTGYVAKNSPMRDYYIKLAGNTGWTGMVQGLRFRVANGQPGPISIDLIELLPYYPGAITPPGVPSTGLIATNNPQMTFSWDPAIPTPPNQIAFYRMQVSNGSVIVLDLGTENANPSFTFTAPTPGLAYSMQVIAYDTSGNLQAGGGYGPGTWYDTVPPFVPTGLVATATSMTSVELNWNPTTDPEGPVQGYKIYRNGSYLATVSGTTYTDNTVARGTAYSYRISAIDYVPLESAQSAAVSVTTPDMTIGDAKKLGNGSAVDLANDIVTAVTSDGFYMEEPDRSAGIKVISTQPVNIGAVVDVVGTIGTAANFERIINASSVSLKPSSSVLPLMMVNKAIGGADTPEYNPITGAGQRGVADGVGTNTIGLLIKTSGKVTWASNGWFYIDDGSKATDYSIFNGVRVLCEGIEPPAKDSMVTVTGISSMTLVENEVYRCIIVRSGSDIEIQNP